MSDYCSTCNGTGEVRVRVPALHFGSYMQYVPCPACSAPPTPLVASVRQPVIVITKIVRDANRLLASGKK